MKKKLMVLAGATGVTVILIFLANLEGRRTTTRAPSPEFDVGIPTAQEVRSLVQSYGLRMEESETQLLELRKEIGTLREQLRRADESRSSIFDALRHQFREEKPRPAPSDWCQRRPAPAGCRR